jgi:hypothetical protein
MGFRNLFQILKDKLKKDCQIWGRYEVLEANR